MPRARNRVELCKLFVVYTLRDVWSWASNWRTVPKLGFLSGGSAFGVGFAVTYLVERGRVVSPSGPLIVGDYYDEGSLDVIVHSARIGPGGHLPGALEFATWQYHALHGAQIAISAGDRDTVATAMPTVVLYALPMILLCLAGFSLVSGAGARTRYTAAVRGAGVVVGYLPLAVFSAMETVWTTDGQQSAGTATTRSFGVPAYEAFLYTGLFFPILFGTVGGVLAYRYGIDRSDEAEPQASGRSGQSSSD